jgi:hypothetical protein
MGNIDTPVVEHSSCRGADRVRQRGHWDKQVPPADMHTEGSSNRAGNKQDAEERTWVATHHERRDDADRSRAEHDDDPSPGGQ